MTETNGYKIVTNWLAEKSFQPFEYQVETWRHIQQKKSGIVNAPTGFGKTYAVFLGALINFINAHPKVYASKKNNGLQLLWITPLRALAKDIARAMEQSIEELGLQWKVGIRNGDTSTKERQQQKLKMPEVLIITPESLHLVLAQKENSLHFKNLKIIAVDEWHELLGSKRGVQTELAISRIVAYSNFYKEQCDKINSKSSISIWGISATIGNLQEAADVLLAPLQLQKKIIVKAVLKKDIEVIPIIPDEVENYPWAGHLGIKMASKIIPIIHQSNTTLVFINTRGMSETWYQTILNIAPDLAGAIALHHGSIDYWLRVWVEEALHTQTLKAVVCTASLDLGVDFRPVDTVIQVGSPKGVARFLQRAGRSGHKPGDTSKIYFLPTHALELLEVTALKKAIEIGETESKTPLLLCFDVLIQYLCTLACGDGFDAETTFNEIKKTYCFSEVTIEEWQEIIHFITQGGKALQQYDDFYKVELYKGLYKIRNNRIAMRHRMHIGTIVSDAMLKVKLKNGSYIGIIEEWFISRLTVGDVFTIAGKSVELLAIKDMDVMVREAASKKAIVPSWNGGRMSLTANLGALLRETFNDVAQSHSSKNKKVNPIEIQALHSLFEVQKKLSHIPQKDELLIEQIQSNEGFHLLVYPFEGRLIHEAMSAIIAYRISKISPISFSIAMNDYGFELLSDTPAPISNENIQSLFSTENLLNDIQQSVNSTEMAKRKFRDIAVIGGLIFQGTPGEKKKARHLQSSASLLFNVFEEYDKNNILLRQAFNEVLEQQMDEIRLRNTLNRLYNSSIIIKKPSQFTPLSFPIIADGLNRNNLSSEKIEDRIKRIQQMLAT